MQLQRIRKLGSFGKFFNLVYVFGFLYAFAVTTTVYYNSSLIQSVIGDSGVTLVFSGVSVIIILSYLIYPGILNKYGSHAVTISLLAINIASLLAIAILPDNSITTVIGVFLHLVIVSIIGLTIDIFIEADSSNNEAGKSRGKYLTTLNLAAVIAPSAAGIIANIYGVRNIYMLAAIILIPAIVFLGMYLKTFQDKVYKPITSFKTVVDVVKFKSLRSPIALQLILQCFFATMVIYAPIYLVEIAGLSLDKIGLIMSFALAAYFIELPLGKLLDSLEPKPFILAGTSIMAASLVAFAIVPVTSIILVWILILFLSRVGAAMIEITSETTFFSRVESNDTDAIEVFRLISPASYLIMPIVIGSLSAVFSIPQIFVIIAIVIVISGISVIIFTPNKSSDIYKV